MTSCAFDTRLVGVPTSTGQASRRIAGRLERHGCLLIAAPQSFLVTPQNTLTDGEAARARRWGQALALIAAGFYLPSSA